MRCAACGADNPASATWCGQCYAPFVESAAPPGAAGAESADDRAASAAASSGTRGGAVPAHGHGPDQPGRSGFRRSGDALEWQCVTCGEFNPLDRSRCTVCGTALTARFETPEPQAEPTSWSAAFVLSAVLPGSGHILAGRRGTGFARALLYVIWLSGGVALLTGAGSAAVLAAVPLLLGALLLWAGTLLDLVSLRRGEREVLTGRTLLWLVVGVTILLLLGAFGGAARLR